MKEENDLELSIYRARVRDAHGRLDELQAQGKLDDLWLEYYRIRAAVDGAMARLNRIKYPPKASE